MKEERNKESGLIDKVAESFAEVDLGGIAIPIITVYRQPRDYPDKYVARVFDLKAPTNLVVLRDDLKDLQEDIREHTDMVFCLPEKEDDGVIMGTWI